jgi:S-adenosylhomocysteine hydrolase
MGAAMLATYTERDLLDNTIQNELSMPLLDFLVGQFQTDFLDKVCIIGGQHLLQTTHSMLKKLYKLKLNPENVFLIGKCYSTNSLVLSEMLADGIHIDQNSILFDSHEPFDLFYKNSIRNFYNRIKHSINKRNPKKIIVLDDGGELLSQFNPDDFTCKQIIGIEQTSSGYNKLTKIDLKFPVINVARSWAKLKYESPIISEFSIKKLLKCVPEANFDKVLILGGGAIGSATREKLKNDSTVDIFDTAIERSTINNLEQELPNYDLIVGCTGFVSLPNELHRLLKRGCVLASISSSDREFDAYYLRKKIKKYTDCHLNLSFEGKTLLNSGFPINFDGKAHSVPPKYIQLTRALLVAAILQSVELSQRSSEFLELRPLYQNIAVSYFLEKILSKEEVDLFYPSAIV